MSGGAVKYDSVLELCSDHHRRIVLSALADRRRTLTIRDLAAAVVEHDHPERAADVSGDELSEIHCSLHHRHIPKLEATGFVEYDPARHQVAPTEQFREWESTFSVIIDADPCTGSAAGQ